MREGAERTKLFLLMFSLVPWPYAMNTDTQIQAMAEKRFLYGVPYDITPILPTSIQ